MQIRIALMAFPCLAHPEGEVGTASEKAGAGGVMLLASDREFGGGGCGWEAEAAVVSAASEIRRSPRIWYCGLGRLVRPLCVWR